MEKVSDWEVKIVTSIYALQGIGFLILLLLMLIPRPIEDEYMPPAAGMLIPLAIVGLFLVSSLFLVTAFGIHKGKQWATYSAFALSFLSILLWSIWVLARVDLWLRHAELDPWLIVYLALIGVNLVGIHFLKINKTIKIIFIGIWVVLLLLLWLLRL